MTDNFDNELKIGDYVLCRLSEKNFFDKTDFEHCYVGKIDSFENTGDTPYDRNCIVIYATNVPKGNPPGIRRKC